MLRAAPRTGLQLTHSTVLQAAPHTTSRPYVRLATRKLSTAKKSKDILIEMANFCFNVARAVEPEIVEGNLRWREPGHQKIYFAFIDRATLFAARAAPYESLTFRAVAVGGPGESRAAEQAVRSALGRD